MKKSIIQSLLAVMLLIVPNKLVAQVDAFLPKIFPPSPNASSLEKYAQIPVSNYTGTPNISIPIWNIQLQDFNLPIGLSYHASGIKVAENASWVGLGWALNAGGLVTRSVVNLEDNPAVNYYISPHKIPQSNPGYWFIGQAIGLEDPRIDTEPDIFSFNFNGRTGKFMYDQEGDIHLFPHQDLQVVPGSAGNPWTIITEDGVQYNFGQNFRHERSKTRRYVDGAIVYDEEFRNTWYLTSIALTNGEVITFNYSPEYYSYRSGLSRTQIIEKHTPNRVHENHTIYNTYGIKGYYLSSIVWKTGKIEFHTSKREDLLEYTDNTKPPVKLDLIKIFDYTNSVTPIKTFQLHYGYFGQCSNCSPDIKYRKMRLRLDSLTEMSGDMALKKPPHIFTYDQSNSFPDKDSGKSDHWGYNGGNAVVQGFNGFLHPNESKYYKLPGMKLEAPVVDPDISNTPFNVHRNSNKNPRFPAMRAGTLLEIGYPTGGKTVFEYEPHDYAYLVNGGVPTKTVFRSNQVLVDGSSSVTQQSRAISLTAQTNAEFSFEMTVTCWYPNTRLALDCAEPNAAVNFNKYRDNSIVLVDSDNNEVIAIKWETGDGGFWFRKDGIIDVPRGILAPDVDGFITFEENLNLPADDYTLIVTKDPQSTYDVFGWLSYSQEVPIDPETDKKMAGGLRIKKIANYDHARKVSEKQFEYFDGKLFYEPKYYAAKMNYRYEVITTTPGTISNYYHVFNDRLELNSGDVTAASAVQGTHIGYRQVKVTEKDVNNSLLTNGYTLYNYDNSPFYRRGYSYCEAFLGRDASNPAFNFTASYEATNTYPYPPLLLIDNDLGNLRSTEYFNASGQKVMEEINEYELIKVDTVFGLKVVEHPIKFISVAHTPSHLVYLGWYQYINSWNALKGTKKITYDIPGMKSLVNSTTYEYMGNDHIQTTKTIQTNSDLQQRITTLQYPPDNPTNTQTESGVINTMTTKNMLFPLVSEVKNEANTLISGVNTNYKSQSGNIVRKNTRIAMTNGTYETRITYDKYDTNGNILQYTDDKGIVHSIIWGHNDALPVVQGVGVNHTTLKTAYDQVGGNLNNLYAHPSLSGALVTTYTYDPLVGITSVTDSNGLITHYTYDDLNRLELIKDNDSYILQQYLYHYSGVVDP